MSPGKRTLNAILALIYGVVYVICYVRYLNFYFGYFGYELFPHPLPFLLASLAIGVAPVLLYSGVRALSSIIAVFVYILLYVPIILTFSLGSARGMGEIAGVQLVFMAGMCMMFLADRLLIRSPLEMTTGLDLIAWIRILTIASTLYVLLVYRSNLHFAAFDESVYEQRFANAELGGGLLTRYLSSWLGTVFIPLCLAHGLVARRRLYFAIGTGACVTIYLATAAKSTILLPFIYLGFYLMFKGGRLARIYTILIVSVSLAIGVLLRSSPEDPSFIVSSLLLMRTIGNGGQLTVVYHDFFLTHPQTHFSHINLVQALFGGYPYGNVGLGNVVGEYLWGAEVNANANFWATDGLAALGLLGVSVVSALCAVILMVMNAITREYDRLFVMLCFTPFLLSILNTSLFSAMWSGGGGLLLTFFLLNRRAGHVPVEVTRPRS